MRKRAVLFLVAIGAAAVIVLGAVRWKDIAVRFGVLRLAGNTQLQDAWVESPADTIEGRAVRSYFHGKPDELIRTFLRTVRVVCERHPKEPGDRPPPEFKDLEGLDRAFVTLGMRNSIQPQAISFLFERKDRGVTMDMVWLDQADAGNIAPLMPLYLLLKAAGSGKTTLAEHPGWTFGIRLDEDEDSLSAGIQGQHGGWTSAGDEISLEEVLWAGKELIVFGRSNGAALDPATGRWRAIRGYPRKSGPTCAVPLGDGTILLASITEQETIAFDLYRTDGDSWESVGETSPGVLDHPLFLGGTPIRGDALVFVNSRRLGSRARGFRVEPSGRVSPIRTCPREGGVPFGTAIHSFGSKVFFWGGAGERNSGAIWDADADLWEELPQGGPGSERRLFFSHFKTDDEVIILGGRNASHEIPNGIAFSMEHRSWRRLTVPPEVELKRRPSVGWTGQEEWIWEGSLSKPGPDYAPPSSPRRPKTVSAGLLDLRTGTWKPFPQGGPSPRLAPYSAWTGKEILILGGQQDRWFLRDAWAFNPSTWTWRRLDNFPRSRQECATTL